MLSMLKNLWFLISLGLILSFSLNLNAQVITPPLDPTIKIKKPAAASWRYIKGDNESDTARTATVAGFSINENGQTNDGVLKWTASQIGIMMLAKTDQVNIEAFFSPTQTIRTEINSAYASPVNTTTNIQESQFHFGYLANHNSFGGSFFSKESQTEGYEPIKNSSIGAAYTRQLSKVFFLGGALEIVTEDQTYKPGNTWSNLSFGGSLLSGKPNETQIRLEFSQTSSKESLSIWDKNTYVNIHQGTNELLVSAEIKLGKILLSYQTNKLTNKEFKDPLYPYNQLGESGVKKDRVGGGIIPRKGIIITGYLTMIKHSGIWSMGSSGWYTYDEPSGQSLQFNLGYNF